MGADHNRHLCGVEISFSVSFGYSGMESKLFLEAGSLCDVQAGLPLTLYTPGLKRPSCLGFLRSWDDSDMRHHSWL